MNNHFGLTTAGANILKIGRNGGCPADVVWVEMERTHRLRATLLFSQRPRLHIVIRNLSVRHQPQTLVFVERVRSASSGTTKERGIL